MRTIDTKIDNTAPQPSGRLPADQWNIVATEDVNLVASAGITPDPAIGPDSDKTMKSQAVGIYSSAAKFGVDQGAANTIVINSPYGTAGITYPKRLFQGFQLLFTPVASNTGAVTLNAFGLGVRPLVDHTGAALTGGEILARRPTMVHFEPGIGAGGSWILEPWANASIASGAGTGGSGSSSGSLYTRRVPFYYTGSEQAWVVPSGVTSIKVKLWGAGGGSGNPRTGGPGGFTTCVFTVTPGDTYKIVVGGGGGFTTRAGGESVAPGGYGFGGDGVAIPGDLNRNECGGGGGLSGIFLTSVTKADAKAVAGGGGGGGDSHNGGAGNDTTYSGGQSSTMQGQIGSGCSDASGGGGGGGYEGGNAGNIRSYTGWAPNPAGEGGKSFTVGGATSVTVAFNNVLGDINAPSTTDPDYFGTIGQPGNASSAGAAGNPGFAVIYY